MSENKSQNMPNFASLDDLVEFFDTHDLGEYLDGMPEVQFEVDIQRRTHLFALEEELADNDLLINPFSKRKRVYGEQNAKIIFEKNIRDC